MKFHGRFAVSILMILVLFSITETRDLRPSDHGFTFQNTSTVTESPDEMSFFGGNESAKVPLPEAKNLSDISWRKDGGLSGGGGGEHVRKVWLVVSLVCGLTGVVLLTVAAFIFVYRIRIDSKLSLSFVN